jgi:S-adenosylmethionine:tRNA-ribosyltransferase-isomerase (queuine synthetase)
VASFAGLKNVQKTYAYAIENRFRLFSYGDLTVWIR